MTKHPQAAGLFTLRVFVTHINGIGQRWHAAVPVISAGKAKRIEDWLRDHEATIGIALGGHVSMAKSKVPSYQLARGAPADGDCPNRQLIVPSELDGPKADPARHASIA